MTTPNDIRTPYQKRLCKKRDRLAEIYLRLKAENPEARQNALISAMVNNRLTRASYSAIRRALISKGLYKLKSAKQ